MIRLPRRRVRSALLVAATAAALIAPAAPATAAPVVDLNCTITVTTDNQPGVTPELRHITFESHGLTGTADCTGTVDGEPVTDTGSFGVNGRLIANCTSATGTANFVLRIPTASRTQTVVGSYNIDGANPAVLSGDLTGAAVVTSADGDCFTTPITHSTARLTVHVT